MYVPRIVGVEAQKLPLLSTVPVPLDQTIDEMVFYTELHPVEIVVHETKLVKANPPSAYVFASLLEHVDFDGNDIAVEAGTVGRVMVPLFVHM